MDILKNQRPLLTHTEKGWHWVMPTFARAGALAAAGGLGILFYASQIEPRWIAWPTYRRNLVGWPRALNGYRLVQISDPHLAAGRPLNPSLVRRIVARVNRMRPDLIVLTGDLVSKLDTMSRAGIAELATLHARDGVFAIPGNHDYLNDLPCIREISEAGGAQWLINDRRTIQRSGSEFVIAGVDDAWESTPDLDKTLRGVRMGTPVILMAHESNFGELAARDGRVLLQLSGHSHGGQVRIPGLGPLALPDMAWRYPLGWYRIKRGGAAESPMWLYTSRGLGMAEIPFRLFCRPEVASIILSAADR